MTKRRIILLFALLCLALYGAWRMKIRSESRKAESLRKQAMLAKKTVPLEWLVYEDSVLRFMYPKGWTLKSWVSPQEQVERTWSVYPDITKRGNPKIGSIHLSEYLDGREKRPLERLVVEKWLNSQSKPTTKPRRFDLKGATCLVYIAEGPPPGGCGDIVTLDARRRPCIWGEEYADCYRENGNYLEIWSHLSRYYNPGEPDEDYKNNVIIFERFLQSLEFKQVSESSPTPKGK